jgi:hypothetical protein
MELRVQWENEAEVLNKIKKNMDELGNKVRDAMREAACETRDFIAFRGAEDIQEAGNFGDRWVDAWKVEVEETQRTFRVTARMEADDEPVVFWPVFEYGKTIEAKNPSGLMWIPFSGGVFGATGGGADVWPRVYGGKLFRKGNVLYDESDKQARYLGVPSVTIPKKFHLHEIAQDEAQKAGEAFARILKEVFEE